MVQSVPSGAGSGGKGLLITATTLGAAQTLHTAQTGTAGWDQFRPMVVNNSSAGVAVTLVFDPNDGSDNVTITETIPAQSGIMPFVPDLLALPLNDTMVVKVYADTASVVTMWASVQTPDRTNGEEQYLQTGEVTLVQNTDAFRMNGVASSATEADHQIMVPVNGYLGGFWARATANIGGGAAVTATVRVNGADTDLTFTYDVGDTTTVKSSANLIDVSAGDLVAINFATNNAGAPASTMLGAVKFTPDA
jgi:hypothetical protein